ncbi:MAG: aspartate racemase, partial [Aliifodinibius sp.]|nr:aspartate racemase [Fodinibius sp.]NIV12466.1 aspartate racemase [Fodinibius sp.]NIY26156.1 aspartate racemase [Fodinibius sp.]
KAAIKIPMLHIADATGLKIKEYALKRIGLLGTIYTMEQDFYQGRLQRSFDLKILVPEENDREIVNQIIFEELVIGLIKEESKAEYNRI